MWPKMFCESGQSLLVLVGCRVDKTPDSSPVDFVTGRKAHQVQRLMQGFASLQLEGAEVAWPGVKPVVNYGSISRRKPFGDKREHVFALEGVIECTGLDEAAPAGRIVPQRLRGLLQSSA